MHFVFICICPAIFCVMTSSPSARSSAALLKLCDCFSPYNSQSFSPFWCLSVAFLRSIVYICYSQSHSSLFCCCLLSIIKCTLSSCTFHFFKPVFVISWSSLWQTNFIPSTVRPVSFAVAAEIFDLLIVFNSVLLVSLFPSTFLLLFSYSACSYP